MTDTIQSLGVGVLIGALGGFFKYLLLWRISFLGKGEITENDILFRHFFGMLINVGVLLAIYLYRDVLPYEYSYLLVGAAVALIVSNRLNASQKLLVEKQKAKKKAEHDK